MEQPKETGIEPMESQKVATILQHQSSSTSSSSAIPEGRHPSSSAADNPMDGDDEDSGDSEETESSTRKQRRNTNSKGKLDRSKLRKGKWTVEEEEYTSRIIHYFGIGLLTLPEGATLRTYLAEKLNCDPMRITKKYAGASCLGRRVYHFQNRMQPTVADIQVAKAELDHLEHRFRARAAGEAGAGELPLAINTSQSLIHPSTVQPAPSPATAPAANPALQALLAGLAQAPQGEQQQLQQQQLPMSSMVPMPSQAPMPAMASSQPHQGNDQQQQMMQMLLVSLLQAQQGANPTGNLFQPPPSSTQSQTPAPWLMPQSIASIGSMYPQMAAAATAPTPPQIPTPPAPAASTTQPQSKPLAIAQPQSQQQRIQDTLMQLSQAQQLQAQIQQHQVKLQQQLAKMNAPAVAPPVAAPEPTKKRKSPTMGQKELKEAYERHLRSQQAAPPPPAKKATPQAAQPRTEEDKAAGNALLGFLCSLRQSYEYALRNENDSSTHSSQRPARVSDESNAASESGEANQSSIEDSDWNSDKKTDPSSSEDSDKEERASAKRAKVSTHDTNRQGTHGKHGEHHREGVMQGNRQGSQLKKGEHGRSTD